MTTSQKFDTENTHNYVLNVYRELFNKTLYVEKLRIYSY